MLEIAEAKSQPSQSPEIAFLLFILLNAILFLRPTDIVPALEGWPLYLVVISGCLALSWNVILVRLTPQSLMHNPISACVVGVLVSVVLSHCSHGALSEAARCGSAFLKVVLYYFLLVSLVDSPERYRRFLSWISLFVVIVTVLPLLQYHRYVDIPAIEPYHERQDTLDPVTGMPVVLARLKSTGLYDNPNDLSRILVAGIILGIYWLNDQDRGMRRVFWLISIGLFGYALHLTHSRGGLLSLLAGLFGLAYQRFGQAKTVLVSALILPVLLLAFAGRQTNIDTSSGTGQERIKLWNEGFVLLQRAPLFGIGMEQYAEEVGLGAHNSFVHCFVELGLIGGTFFFSIFYIPLRTMIPVSLRETIPDTEFARFHPYLWGLLVATVVGMLSSTRSYSLPTYLIAGLTTSFFAVKSKSAISLDRPLPLFDSALLGRLSLRAILFIAAIYVYVRLESRYDG